MPTSAGGVSPTAAAPDAPRTAGAPTAAAGSSSAGTACSAGPMAATAVVTTVVMAVTTVVGDAVAAMGVVDVAVDAAAERAGTGCGVTEQYDLDVVRARLAVGQSALLTALVAGVADPPGFDPTALDATRQVLLAKRRDSVARHWPALAAEPGFAARFLSWAAGRPPAGARADGLAFGRAHRDILSEDTRVELLRARCAQHRLTVLVDRAAGGTLIALRAPALGVVILRAARPAGRPGRR
ncbi:hypothetical protein [Frankia sp. AgB32]|uniref:hypothetical protein n=1 Tax=Frankia sp. AgB32 TaxID=631119 RepID=UPI00200C30AC|nr:hypothetical protein [Frankia sp. AgB32]MCK9894957.1 hypothetical protein [Frankia sp. AgB32]